ncbi:MAG TPA: YciI-like protein [Sphingomicrobium sp.]
MKHFLLFYDYVPDILERRPAFRGPHLKHAWAAQERGELVVAGALADPVDGAVLMFAADNASVAEEFAKADPYVTGGLVERWHVREWTTVIGDHAATKVMPSDV